MTRLWRSTLLLNSKVPEQMTTNSNWWWKTQCKRQTDTHVTLAVVLTSPLFAPVLDFIQLHTVHCGPGNSEAMWSNWSNVSPVDVDCITHRCEHASNVLPLPVRRRWSRQTSPSARHQPKLQDHRYRLVYHAMCLFTSPAFARYLFRLPTEGRLRLTRCWCLLLHGGGLPVLRRSVGHPSRH